MQRGDVIRVQLPLPTGMAGHEQHGVRPAVVIQDDKASETLPTIVIIPLTSKRSAERFSDAIVIHPTGPNGLTMVSIAMVHQIRALDKNRVEGIIGRLSSDDMTQIEQAVSRLLCL